MQAREAEATGIGSLKIGYNNVFGYYIEVTNTHRDKVPETWIRKQTLVNAERYITPELKEYEEQILGAPGKDSGNQSPHVLGTCWSHGIVHHARPAAQRRPAGKGWTCCRRSPWWL